ncbi:cytochrome P450 family protein [Actinorugispora endophytica]|uniref:cytochrome P450 family protein n=1 Tax=Actinorugispora endophytica TaxID=1605990 RepID=UPI00105D47D0|nr:cytochrome P450 [Actinorugispora endophytica]
MAFPGLEVWAVTHDAELRAAMADEATFVRGWRNWRALAAGEIDAAHPVAAMMRVESMIARSGDDHRRLRGLVQAGFTRRRVEALRPRVEALTTSLLHRMARRGGVVDLKAAFAFPLPMMVISDLLGLDPADQESLSSLVTRILSGTDPTANTDAFAFAVRMVRAKRAAGDDALISALIDARDGDGDALTEEELVWSVLLLVVGGFETTVGMIGNSVKLLLNHPEQLALLRGGRVSWEQAVEECLRFDPSVAMLPFLYTTRDVEMGGVTIPKGEAVLMCYAAANRDPAAHAVPDRFDTTRGGNRHMAFGHAAHLCLGAPLARLELAVALPALFRRFPDIALAAPTEPMPSVFMNHPQSIPVRLFGSGGPAG